MMMVVAVVLAGFLLGSVPFAYLLASRLAGVDLRRVGSGNVGATNALRTTRPWIGLVALLLDVAKGAFAVVLARALVADEAVAVATGVAAVLGHVYPPWLGFRGGKGVATAAGVFGLLAPGATLWAVVVFLLMVAVTQYVSLGSVAAAVVLPAVLHVTGARGAIIAGASVVAAIIVFRHRANLARLLAGAEPRVKVRGTR